MPEMRKRSRHRPGDGDEEQDEEEGNRPWRAHQQHRPRPHAVATLGVSNLVWKKSKGMDYTKNKNAAVAVCQKCGHMWEP